MTNLNNSTMPPAESMNLQMPHRTVSAIIAPSFRGGSVSRFCVGNLLGLGLGRIKMRANITSSRLANSLVLLLSYSLGGCSADGAPSFDLFGAFFPAWLLCGIIGIAGAAVARAAFVSSGLANTLPYQLAVCTAIGVITALVVWLAGFGH
jgi:YtcA family